MHPFSVRRSFMGPNMTCCMTPETYDLRNVKVKDTLKKNKHFIMKRSTINTIMTAYKKATVTVALCYITIIGLAVLSILTLLLYVFIRLFLRLQIKMVFISMMFHVRQTSFDSLNRKLVFVFHILKYCVGGLAHVSLVYIGM